MNRMAGGGVVAGLVLQALGMALAASPATAQSLRALARPMVPAAHVSRATAHAASPPAAPVAATPAAPNVPAACLAPLGPQEHDPAVRDLHLHVGPASGTVTISMCLVSNRVTPVRSASITVGLFSDVGRLITTSSMAFENFQAQPGSDNGLPRLILLFHNEPAIEPAYIGHLNGQSVVQVAWIGCQAGDLPNCDPAAPETSTNLVAAALNQPQLVVRAHPVVAGHPTRPRPLAAHVAPPTAGPPGTPGPDVNAAYLGGG
jgi:hypothetical protein